MEGLGQIIHWGSPLGLALFFFFSASGAGIFFWGISHLNNDRKKDKEDKT